jgi:hypothetical protein
MRAGNSQTQEHSPKFPASFEIPERNMQRRDLVTSPKQASSQEINFAPESN